MKNDESIRFRDAEVRDLPELEALFPQLADFEVPPRRNPEHLWAGDLALARRVIAGDTRASFCEVGEVDGPNGDVLAGVILVTLRGELMSGEDSAHLEAIAVTPAVRGRGFGQALLDRAESQAKSRGASSMSLHVFGNNQRARGLYAGAGYDEELIRAIKWLT